MELKTYDQTGMIMRRALSSDNTLNCFRCQAQSVIKLR
jgi:hypothetical protein